MRIAMADDARLGVIGVDDTFVDVDDLLQPFEPLGPQDLLPDLITHFDALRPTLARRVAAGGGQPLDRVALRSPVVRPSKIVCLIGNYREGTDRPPQLLDIFFKSPEAIVGPRATVLLPPHPATIFHHEAELALVVGREAKDLPADARALAALAGYSCAIDVSARGLGRFGPSRIGTSFDTFTPSARPS